MSPQLAKKRYFRMMIGASLGYLASVAGVSFFLSSDAAASALHLVLALVPGIFICLMVLAVWRFMNETDEVARHDMTQAMLTGVFVILGISGSWGLVELFIEELPRLPVFYVFPAFFLIFGLVSGFRYKRCV